MTLPYDLTAAQALFLAAVLLGAGFVRGYSGFGLAALVIAASSLVTSPLHLIPVVILADMILTLQQARGIWAHIDWARVRWLLLGCLPGVPLGVWTIAQVGADTARLIISAYILAMCALLWAGWQMRRPPGLPGHTATGLISGLANGAAVGGLPVAAFFSAQTIPAATFRATLIAYFTVMDIWTLPFMGSAGLITRDTLIATALGLPLMMAGVALGSRRFVTAAPQGFRRFTILLLATLATLGLLRSLT